MPGALVLVAPGTYNENVIIFKPVRLQGAGAGGTFIDGNPTPLERLAAWHARVRSFGEAALTDLLGRNALAENEAPAVHRLRRDPDRRRDASTPASPSTRRGRRGSTASRSAARRPAAGCSRWSAPATSS